ncbi:MAG TPA: hypothetical protein VFQ53_00760 [Kofleriaceae bacterium]|nr:hypothetical protein [Kofleriaceae bacterium]
MKKILSILVLASLCLLAGPSFAGTKTHRASQIQFWVPDNWQVEGEDRDQLQASDPKGEVSLLFMVRDAKDMKAALAAIDDTIAKVATDVKAGTPEKITLNGMEAVVVDATGKAEGKPVELSVLLVKTPAKKYLTVFGVLEADHKKAHEANLTKILQSLQPTKKR